MQLKYPAPPATAQLCATTACKGRVSAGLVASANVEPMIESDTSPRPSLGRTSRLTGKVGLLSLAVVSAIAPTARTRIASPGIHSGASVKTGPLVAPSRASGGVVPF